MKTDDRATRQRNEAEGDEAKVVRLSDWLGPDDELVPFGPRAHARRAARESAERRSELDSGAEPPAASGFWDGDTSVHTAVPGPGMFDEPMERTVDQRRYRRSVPVWRPALPPLPTFGREWRARERLDDLVDWLSWKWAAVGVAFLGLVLAVLVVTLGGSSSGHHKNAAQAGIGDTSPVALSGTLGELGTAIRAAAVADLRPLPPVDIAAVRTIGVATEQARALRARDRRHVVVVTPVSEPASSTTESVAPPATAAPTETTPAPTETEPVQTPSSPTTTTGGGGGSSGGGSSSGSQKQPAFGAAGSLGPGSSPNG